MNPTSTKWFSPFWKSLFTWRNARRVIISAAIIATLLAVLYAEENWRGKRAWENCKRELEAKGVNFDWASYVPAPVPDEQNVFRAPKMTEWFMRKGWEGLGNLGGEQNELSKRLGGSPPSGLRRSNDVVAVVTFLPRDNARGAIAADLVLEYSDRVLSLATNLDSQPPEKIAATKRGPASSVVVQPAAQEALQAIIQKALSGGAGGIRGLNLRMIGFMKFIDGAVTDIKTMRLIVLADRVPTAAEVEDGLLRNLDLDSRNGWRVIATGSNSFKVTVAKEYLYSASEYLAWSDQFEPEFATIREGLRRPQVQVGGDAQRPFAQPIPDFLCLRNLGHLLAERAQCCLILGKSEQALKELTLLYELRRLLEGKPTLLVAAMIDVAITGLYVQIIADGLALRAWREPELIALQKQLADLNLPTAVLASLRTEGAATCQTLLQLKPDEIIELFRFEESKSHPWKKFTDPTYLLIKFAPRGWVYQNLVLVANAGQSAHFGNFDPNTGMVYPGKIAEGRRIVEATRASKSPFAILARGALPNFSKAMQTATRNQTFANEAFLVCALERYRMARGEYPDSLSALVPFLANPIPKDLMGGRPLSYRRTAGGKFELYSVGWNESDDGGTTVHHQEDAKKGDWVWPMQVR